MTNIGERIDDGGNTSNTPSRENADRLKSKRKGSITLFKQRVGFFISGRGGIGRGCCGNGFEDGGQETGSRVFTKAGSRASPEAALRASSKAEMEIKISVACNSCNRHIKRFEGLLEFCDGDPNYLGMCGWIWFNYAMAVEYVEFVEMLIGVIQRYSDR